MEITETFPAPETAAGRLFWQKPYVRLAREGYAMTVRRDIASKIDTFVANAAMRWGISRKCAELILKGEAKYEVTPEEIIITREVRLE
jgi:hypothetical protein